ncbi:MAG: SDR family oxidoreductase [Chlorobiaceae bacterium]|nr:SDR family oxidoreductase [Chlorobiaceae bacterium]NTV61485.1 SDR family oxidoreductase [Chlorobiaceae bacterium]
MMTEKPVCVTGASGFIASHIVRELLGEGYRVRGTVRKNPESYPYLLSLPGAAERLELVNADLLAKGSFDHAVAECEYVIHTASPFEISISDPQSDLVDPAVNGTESVLESCIKAGSVKRVVLTSSIAAITDEPENDKIYTENDWNTMSSLSRNPYYYSKTLAERAAWDFIMHKRTGFDLVAINPPLVLGPSLSPALNTSKQMIRDIMMGEYPAIMDMNWGFTDVRDVAKIHRLAMETKRAEGRYLCTGDTIHMRDLVALIKSSGFTGYRLPNVDLSGKTGSALITLLSFTKPRNVGKYIRTQIGRTMNCDITKLQSDFSFAFMPVKTSIIETIEDLVRWGHLKTA